MSISRIQAFDAEALRSTPKRILVTGGAGFLGSHLCDRFLMQGHEVICLDNFYSSTKQNIQHMLSNPNFEFIRHDVTFPVYLEVDEIYNMACPASPVHYQSDPVQTTKTSVHGAINMLGLAKRTGAKILQASTSEVYGDPVVHPDYHRQHNVQTKVVRIFNTYGPRMHPNDGRVVSNFIVQALLGEDITIFGDGSQTRSFCFVDDLVEAIIRTMNSDDDFIGPVNIGNPGEFTMLELAEKIQSKVESESKIVFKPLPINDPTQRKPDISLAKEKLDWEPTVSLDQGLDTTINYFRSQVGGGGKSKVA